ncbi:glycosyltransferase family 2 protein [Selenomonas ruminantium]|uniref:tetratricopeptide repeat-containing glycosyltransferase family 2 protein n=1 Tax=Selenomonas ruminantium TaxID=971 RepID=UPI00068D4E6C|nr:glycosyltransferase family 2 protein [Selenomonas ruminantium]
MRIHISACVIVKNEAENIGRWLASMCTVADEMIVVDTGSSDNTVELAQKSGAKVYYFEWCNDFAAAKNFALEKAKGNWILFLDADEYFTPESQPKVRPLIERLEPNQKIDGVLCRLVNIDVDDNNRIMTTLVQLRMFRNKRNLRYKGKVHEVLTLTKGNSLELANEIEIYHTGYSTHVVQAKMRRNLKLIEERIAANGGRKEPMDDRYLMDIWYGLGNPDKAIAYAKLLLAQEKLSLDLRGRAYETWASCCIEHRYPAEETAACLQAAIRACPDLAEFPLMRGLWRFERREYLLAKVDLNRGLELEKAYNKNSIEGVMDNAARLLPSVYWRLGELAEMQGDGQKAQDFYVQGLRANRYHRGLFAAFWRFLRRQGIEAADSIAVLNALYNRCADAAFLARQLTRQNGGLVYVYYAKQAGINDQPILECLAAGRPDGAAQLAVKQLNFLYQMGMAAADDNDLSMMALLPQEHEAIDKAAQQLRKDMREIKT